MIYLDDAAAVKILPEAKKAVMEALDKYYGNASALHSMGHAAAQAIEKARESVAALINAKPSEIIFTASATESNNTVMHTFAKQKIEISPYEHPSVLEPKMHFSGDGSLEPVVTGLAPSSVAGAPASRTVVTSGSPRKKTFLGSYTLACGELGDIFALPKGDFYLHSDLSAALAKMPIDVKKLGLDYATISAHKIGGPVGVAALYVKNGVPFEPLIIGGKQENGRRAGTYNTAGIVGFGAACEYHLKNKTWEKYEKQVRPLRDKFAKELLDTIPRTIINTDLENSLPNILNASFYGAEGEAVQLMLDEAGIIVSTGSACAAGEPSRVVLAKTHDPKIASSSIRFSLNLDTTEQDLDYVLEKLSAIIKKLQGISTL